MLAISDALPFIGLLVVVALLTLGAVYLVFRRGIALRLNGIVVGMTSLAALAGFVFGKQGVQLSSMAVAVVLVSPAYFLLLSALKRIVIPIHEISQMARSLAEGDLGQDKDIHGWDEIQTLAEAFHHLREYMLGVTSMAEKVASGNLAVEIQAQSDHDALGQTLLRMVGNLREAIAKMTGNIDLLSREYGRIAYASDQTSRAVGQISERLESLAHDTAEQLRSLTATTQAIEQMALAIDGVSKGAQEQAHAVADASQMARQITERIYHVAESAHSAAQESNGAARVASQSAETIRESVRRMERIAESTRRLREKVDLMGKHSEQIGSIVETSQEIASQTNLLALNAAIEAARAGEQGKGFAVVADEVRKLAEKSIVATKEIAGLVQGIRDTVNETVQAIHDQVLEVEEGVAQSQHAGAALESILDSIDHIRGQMEQISQATDAIRSATDSLLASMETVSAVVEENTASTEEIAASASEVSAAIRAYAQLSEQGQHTIGEISTAAHAISQQVSAVAEAIQKMSELTTVLQQQITKLTTKQISGKVSRGSALIGRLDFVREKYGSEALERVLQKMSPEQQKILRGKIDAEGEYPPELLGALTNAIKNELAGGRDDILREMTRYRAKYDIQPGAALAKYFKPGDPGYIIRRMDLCLRHNWGDGVVVRIVDVAENHVRMEVDMGKKQPRERCTYNHVGWMEGVIEAAGGIPFVKKTRCMYDGAPFCEYDVRWEMKRGS